MNEKQGHGAVSKWAPVIVGAMVAGVLTGQLSGRMTLVGIVAVSALAGAGMALLVFLIAGWMNRRKTS